MERIEVTRDDLLDALREAWDGPADDGSARTVAELCEAVGACPQVVRARLKALIARGEAEMVKVLRPRIDGAMVRQPAYRSKARGAQIRAA